MSEPKPAKRIQEFEEMGYGMFIHWGLYAQLGRGVWVQDFGKIELEEYTKLKDNFKAENYRPKEIVKLAKQVGMKYITLTTRHHEGFSLYDTRGLCEYDAVHSPAQRDLVAEFVEACNEEGIKPFFYHTTLDWYQESFEKDFDSYLEYLKKSVEILCRYYGEIGGIWFDGNWSKLDADWKEDELYGMIRKYQPKAIIINNTGIGALGEVGHPEIDSVTYEQGVPKPMDRSNMSKYVAGEMCYPINEHWGYTDRDFCYKSPRDLIKTLCKCRRAGANFLLNIGPDATGAIPEMMKETLKVIGEWIKIYGEAIYTGKPSKIIGEGDNFGLKNSEGKRYLFVFDLPVIADCNSVAESRDIVPVTFTGVDEKVKQIKWLDNNEMLGFMQDDQSGVLTINTKRIEYGRNYVVRVAEVI